MGQSTVKLESAPGRLAALETARARSSLKPTDAVVAAAENAGVERVNFWRFLWPSLYPYRWLILAALALNSLHGFSITLQTVAPKYLIDDVILVNGLTMHQRWRRLAVLLGVYLLASIFGRMLVWHSGYRIFTYVREKVLFNVRATFFRHVNHLCLRFHRQHHSGELFSYLFGSPLLQIQTYFQQLTFAAPGAFFIVITTLIWVGKWDWQLALVMLGTVLSTVWVMQRTRSKIQRLHSDYQKTETKVTGYVADLLRGSRDVKLYAMEDQVAADFDNRVWEVGQKSYQRDVKAHVQWMKWETTGYFCFAILCAAIGLAIFLRSIPQTAGPPRDHRRTADLSDSVRVVAGESVDSLPDVEFQGCGAGGGGANRRGIEDGQHHARSDRV